MDSFQTIRFALGFIFVLGQTTGRYLLVDLQESGGNQYSRSGCGSPGACDPCCYPTAKCLCCPNYCYDKPRGSYVPGSGPELERIRPESRYWDGPPTSAELPTSAEFEDLFEKINPNEKCLIQGMMKTKLLPRECGNLKVDVDIFHPKCLEGFKRIAETNPETSKKLLENFLRVARSCGGTGGSSARFVGDKCSGCLTKMVLPGMKCAPKILLGGFGECIKKVLPEGLMTCMGCIPELMASFG